jgi:Anti-anti-sigma regulatory factor (antagonist of anti-sigma factor)
MTTGAATIKVRRLTAGASEIAIGGDVTSASEGQLIDAYHRASAAGARVIVLDFGHLVYMNSGGIGILVTLLVRAQRQGQRLMAVGLSDHYRQILALTRLDESIGIHATAAEALAAAGT